MFEKSRKIAIFVGNKLTTYSLYEKEVKAMLLELLDDW